MIKDEATSNGGHSLAAKPITRSQAGEMVATIVHRLDGENLETLLELLAGVTADPTDEYDQIVDRHLAGVEAMRYLFTQVGKGKREFAKFVHDLPSQRQKTARR